MPARNEFGNKTKKKKGRAPSHQNKFAFKHNPSSKKTEKILSMPNIHVCQRCYDKIEWRKKYRKYKPRTQPGKCNECPKRNVKAAYHTICTDCTTGSAKAKEVIRKSREESPELDETTAVLRACAVCVKEIALPDPPGDDDDDDRDYVDAMSRLNLRQKRALERKAAKEQLEREREKKSKGRDDSDNDDHDNDDDDDDNEETRGRGPLDASAEDVSADEDNNSPDYGDDDDDPFLKAIGGADKLLTGEAYQRKLLEQQEEKQQ